MALLSPKGQASHRTPRSTSGKPQRQQPTKNQREFTKEFEKWQQKNEHELYKFWDKKYPEFNLDILRT